MKAKYNYILTIIFIFLVCASASVKAENIYGRNYNDPSDTWTGYLGLIPTADTEKRVASLPVYMINAIVIDTPSVTVDTAGLAGYQQIEDIKTKLDEAADTYNFIYDSINKISDTTTEINSKLTNLIELNYPDSYTLVDSTYISIFGLYLPTEELHENEYYYYTKKYQYDVAGTELKAYYENVILK